MVVFAGLAVASLIAGVVVFALNRKGTGRTSNKLMIARVVFQGLTILALAALVFFKN